MFVDEVDIIVRAGKGGDGCVAFLREKYRPLGGPAGGDGGKGGSIIFQAHPGLRTLADFRGRRIITAKNGMPGEGKNRKGQDAADVIVMVPVGTVIRDRNSGEIIADLIKPRQKVVVARGGRGGRGNARFATPVNRAPRTAEKGEPGEEKELRLELRLLADVGVVGLPNAGKSTLVGAVSTVRPRVADYPFTTLYPSVGVVRLGDFVSFTIADLPGLIALAHEGKGLGLKFLRHIKRTSIICHLVEIPLHCESLEERFKAMVDAYETVRKELAAYDPELVSKPEIVCWTKADLFTKELLQEFKASYGERFLKETGCSSPPIVISAVRGDGVSELLREIVRCLNLDLNRPAEGVSMEYVDGELPGSLPADELSMDNINVEEDRKLWRG